MSNNIFISRSHSVAKLLKNPSFHSIKLHFCWYGKHIFPYGIIECRQWHWLVVVRFVSTSIPTPKNNTVSDRDIWVAIHVKVQMRARFSPNVEFSRSYTDSKCAVSLHPSSCCTSEEVLLICVSRISCR